MLSESHFSWPMVDVHPPTHQIRRKTMKFWRRTATMAAFSGLILLIAAMSANACHVVAITDPLVWQPKDDNSLAVNLGTGESSWALFLTDDLADPLNDPKLMIAQGGTASLTQIEFGRDSATAGGESIVIGNDLTFMFYFYDGTNYQQGYAVTQEGTNMFALSYPSAMTTSLSAECAASYMTVLVDDIAQVPVPPAVLLLGSGLVGLIGFRRKMRGR
jgi:hypothetical protein